MVAGTGASSRYSMCRCCEIGNDRNLEKYAKRLAIGPAGAGFGHSWTQPPGGDANHRPPLRPQRDSSPQSLRDISGSLGDHLTAITGYRRRNPRHWRMGAQSAPLLLTSPPFPQSRSLPMQQVMMMVRVCKHRLILAVSAIPFPTKDNEFDHPHSLCHVQPISERGAR